MSQDLLKDIRAEVLQRFSKEDQATALEIVAEFDGPRLMRCAIHSSKGDLERLLGALDVARRDYRDLIFWTEYDRSEKRIWDFNRPFHEAKLPE